MFHREVELSTISQQSQWTVTSPQRGEVARSAGEGRALHLRNLIEAIEARVWQILPSPTFAIASASPQRGEAVQHLSRQPAQNVGKG